MQQVRTGFSNRTSKSIRKNWNAERGSHGLRPDFFALNRNEAQSTKARQNELEETSQVRSAELGLGEWQEPWVKAKGAVPNEELPFLRTHSTIDDFNASVVCDGRMLEKQGA